ncbi:hypothetical protein [Gordonia amicalis]|uniref:hypothetical protein n=1 Tax=Gordonia amicalis TaxID=89053 RepID=UPI0004165160|nr:hypothetical protein [Gordonia amicalis]
MSNLYEAARERQRCEALAGLGLNPDMTPKAQRSTLDRARETADEIEAAGGGFASGLAVASALAAVASAESADRSAAALESIARSLAVIAEAAR